MASVMVSGTRTSNCLALQRVFAERPRWQSCREPDIDQVAPPPEQRIELSPAIGTSAVEVCARL